MKKLFILGVTHAIAPAAGFTPGTGVKTQAVAAQFTGQFITATKFL